MHKDVCRRPAGHLVAAIRGFTLIELLVTLSIVAILALVAVPGMGDLIADSRIAETRSRLFSTLSLARSEAVRRGMRVAVCSTANGESCKKGYSAIKAVWTQALLFADADEDRIYDAKNGDQLIRVIDLQAGADVFWGNRYAIVYDSDGSIWGLTNGSFYIYDQAEIEAGVKLVLQKTGRLRQMDFTSADVTKLYQYLGQ